LSRLRPGTAGGRFDLLEAGVNGGQEHPNDEQHRDENHQISETDSRTWHNRNGCLT
jgi:hypothetical protein